MPGVTELRSFDEGSFLNVENVFIPKQRSPACPAGELAIEGWIVVGAPADLGNVKVTRNA